jgi:hypothetical protein
LHGIAQVKVVRRRVRHDFECRFRTSSTLALRFGSLLLRLGVVEKAMIGTNDRVGPAAAAFGIQALASFHKHLVSVKARAFRELQRPLDAVS